MHNFLIMKKLLPVLLIFPLFFYACKEEVDTTPPVLQLFLDGEFVSDSSVLAINDSIVFRIKAEGVSSQITSYRVDINSESGTTTPANIGVNTDVLDETLVFSKGLCNYEEFVITVMDYNRNTASASFIVFLDTLSGFGPVYHFSNITLGYQNNSSYGHFLNPFTGDVYNETSVAGHESEVYIAIYYYVSSGSPSPTLACPVQSDIQSTYTSVASWSVQNEVLYDYHAADYNTISVAAFDACTNDSLLIAAYDPTYTNQKCKFATAGKVIPFLTSNGKKGLIKINSADLNDTGTMNVDIKIQQ